MVGGYAGNWIPSNNLFIYDPATNNWTLGNPMPTPRDLPNANFVNGIMYIIGIDSYDHSHIVVEGYDPITNEWMYFFDANRSTSCCICRSWWKYLCDWG